MVHGAERVVDAEQARGRGLTLVDLSDDWAPAIFQDGTAADGSPLPNRYRPIYDGLASDRTDGDGQPLRPGERNFLELYGIPPSLSALHARFLADGDRPCFAQVDTARLLAVPSIPSWGSASEKKELARAKERADRLAQSAGAIDAGMDALAAADPKLAKELKAHQQFEAERAAFAEAEKRLACEGLLDGANHIPGSYDTPMRFAMLAFQRKNVVMAEADITRGTLEALARSPLDNAFLALQRVLAERAADAGGFIEDGSAGGRDLVGEATAAVMARLGVQTPEQALAFFRRRRPEDFTWLRAAVRLPEAPSYYGAHMDLVGEIDRGDVWYDFPFDGKGQRLPQPRSRYPSFTLFVREARRKDGKKLPLVRWRTTIGSWRTELASDGQEYLRYKDSDVGPRVWRHVVAAPVWVPYGSSPVGGMVKEKWVNGALMKVTNYDEVGPGLPVGLRPGGGHPRRASAAQGHCAISTTASAPTARSTTPRCAGASPTAATGCRTTWRCACSRSWSGTGATRCWVRWPWMPGAASGGRARCSTCGCPRAATTSSWSRRCRSRRCPGRSRASCRSRWPGTCASPGRSTPRAAPPRPRAGPRPRREGRRAAAGEP